MSIIMKKKRKEPINKIAIRPACSCKEHNTDKCPCGCTDTTPKYLSLIHISEPTRP